MTDIRTAVEFLRSNSIDAFESGGIVVIPCSNPEEIYDMANIVRRYFKEIGYEKSWQINPYYYDTIKRMKGDFDL